MQFPNPSTEFIIIPFLGNNFRKTQWITYISNEYKPQYDKRGRYHFLLDAYRVRSNPTTQKQPAKEEVILTTMK